MSWWVKSLLPAVVLAWLLALPTSGAGANNALDVLDKGPAVGAPLPHNLATVDQFNNPTEFSALRRKRGLILLFSRSFDW